MIPRHTINDLRAHASPWVALKAHLYLWLFLILHGYAAAVAQSPIGSDSSNFEILVGKAHRQLELGLLRKAANPLHKRVDQIDPSNVDLSSGYHRLSKLLARVYLASADYAEAQTWVKESDQFLGRFADIGGELTSERAQLALIQGQIFEQQNRTSQSPEGAGADFHTGKTTQSRGQQPAMSQSPEGAGADFHSPWAMRSR